MSLRKFVSILPKQNYKQFIFAMDSRFYDVKLAGHKIFKDLKDNLSENPSGKLRNLLELSDDVLYVWNSIENCIMTINLKHLEESNHETPYQKLQLISPPAFSVERLMTSPCGSRICVWGSRGVTIVELPSRWGRGGLFDSGNQVVLCKSFSLDERFLYCQGEIRRVHWHPSSLSHVLILVSDNTLRLYNIALKAGPKLVKIFPIGPKPRGLLSGRTLLDSLGDTAVDFTALPDTDCFLILRGNGDVYMMEFELGGKTSLSHQLSGPLAMYPPAEDNYGTESCSVAVLGGTAPLVVVATCSGALYHCLLLPNATDKQESHSHALYVVEAVEINMSLTSDGGEHYSYPVHLYPCTNTTYACAHAGGVHTVTLPILGHLTDFALAEHGDIDTVLSAMCSKPSVARHLVCTSAAGGCVPPLGVGLSHPPLPRLLVLCDDCTLLSRTLEPYDLEERLYKELQLKNPALEQDDINNLLKERQKLSFTTIIQEILTRDVSQPILNVNKNKEMSPKECLELVSEATLKLRGEYISRQQRAADALSSKVRALLALTDARNCSIAALQQEVEEAKKQSHVLREKCLLAEKHQEDLKYRCSSVIRHIRGGSAPSPAERELLRELRHYRARGDAMLREIADLRGHVAGKADELQKWKEDYKKNDIALGRSHSETIVSILQQQTNQIGGLIEETKLLKDQLSIV